MTAQFRNITSAPPLTHWEERAREIVEQSMINSPLATQLFRDLFASRIATELERAERRGVRIGEQMKAESM